MKNGDRPTRDTERYRVNLPVRYRRGGEIQIGCVENLSRGGMFSPDISGASVGTQFEMTLTLPGCGDFDLVVEVAHVLDPQEADHHRRVPGLGLRVVSAPEEYQRAVVDYLERLGRRGESMVLVGDDRFAVALAATGYQTMPLPPAGELCSAIAGSPVPVIGVIVAGPLDDALSGAVSMLDGKVAVITDAGPRDLDRVLITLDQVL